MLRFDFPYRIGVFREIVLRAGFVVVIISAFASCKKEIVIDPDPPSPPPNPVVQRTTDELVRDSVYHYYKLYSLWTERIPVYDPISEFTDGFTSPNQVLNALKGQTPYFPFYGGAIDRFSFLESISSSSSGSARADNADGYGIYTTIVQVAPTVGHFYIHFVEGNSPADLAGIRRGDRIVSIGEQTDIEVPLAEQNGRLVVTNSTNVNLVRNALAGGALKLGVQRREEESLRTVDLTYRTYPIDPVVMDTIYEVSGKKIGYFALSSFEELYNNGSPSAMHNNINRIFDEFGQADVSDLIIDLRYNTGGYVSTTIFLADKIINNAGDGKLMFSYGVNANLEPRRTSRTGDFRDVYFEKSSSIDAQNVYFLVTTTTASAAEILISVMLPYFPNAQIIAEEQQTYGKPVGFFPQDILGRVRLWVTSFSIINANGYTDYYEGIPATRSNVRENYFVDFGDPEETMIAEAVNHASTGAFLSPSLSQQRASVRTNHGGSIVAEKVLEVNQLPQRHLLKD